MYPCVLRAFAVNFDRMSNDIDRIYDAHRDLARKRLAAELHFLVKWQVVALFVAVLGLPFCTGFSLLIVFGIIMFLIPVLWAFGRLAETSLFPFTQTNILVLPSPIGYYACVGIIILVITFLISGGRYRPPLIFTHTHICLFVFLCYCPIPQYFIARWLARQTEEDVQIEGLPEEKRSDWDNPADN